MLRPVSIICSQLEQLERGNKLTGNIKIHRFGKMAEKCEETLDEKVFVKLQLHLIEWEAKQTSLHISVPAVSRDSAACLTHFTHT